jgi:hypothetical protein
MVRFIGSGKLMMEQSKMLSLSHQIYNLLLRAYPDPFRREYGRYMAQLFRDDMRGTLQENGTTALIGLWLLTFIDLIKTAIAEHIWEVFHMPMEKLQRWTGPAAAIAGILWASLFFIEVEGALGILLLGLAGAFVKNVTVTSSRLSKIHIYY